MREIYRIYSIVEDKREIFLVVIECYLDIFKSNLKYCKLEKNDYYVIIEDIVYILHL